MGGCEGSQGHLRKSDAMRLKQLGDDVLLTTTYPTNHINAQKAEEAGIDVAVIDVKKELKMTIN